MNFLLRTLPIIAMCVNIMNRSINLDFVLIVLSIAILVIAPFSVWIYFQDRKQIRLIVKPAKRISWLDIASLMVILGSLLSVGVLEFKGVLPGRTDVPHFLVIIPGLCILLQLCANVMFMSNSARDNSGYYLHGYIFLESGIKFNGVLRKMYPWDHFTAFEVNSPEHSINLVFLNEDRITLKINKKDFDIQLPAIEMFLREKISSENIPASS